MAYYKICGGKKLFGEVNIEKSKNAILPIMAASLLTKELVTIKNVPNFSDITKMAKILESLGAKVDISCGNMTIDASHILHSNITTEEASKIRASVFLMGPLLSRTKSCKMTKPGGCSIGARPIDIHLSGFEQLGISTKETEEYTICDSSGFVGGRAILRMPSVGATENLIMCAVLQKGKTTTLSGVAKEPEVVDLCLFLKSMGANIVGEGTSTITIVGTDTLHGTTYEPIGDRIVAGTFMLAVALCGGSVTLCGSNPAHNQTLIDFLSGFGCAIAAVGDRIYMSSNGLKSKNSKIETGPFPEFATDLQSQTMALLTVVDGIHTVSENMFESRFKHIPEFVKMGAEISSSGSTATIVGKSGCLKGASVECHDLRGGAALVLCGLAAKGITVVDKIEYIDRGYDNFEQKLALLGADIHRIEHEEEKHHRN